MLTQATTGSRAWCADTIDEPRFWYHRLSERCLAALDETVQELRRQPRAITELHLSASPLARCAGDLGLARTVLEAGRGFVIIEGMPWQSYSAAEQQACYWLVGQSLGHPFAQNVQGTLLYDVRDTGQDVYEGARFSVTNADTGYHTDNSFGDRVLDYVGLLCVRTAKSGGENQLVSGWSVHNALLARYPAVLQSLYEPFHVDRRGGLKPGEAPTNQCPVFQSNQDELLIRYLRHWIEDGHRKASQPLTPAQKEALDVFDRALADPQLNVETTLRPGDMFFINNRWILHKRSAFEDFPEPERRRHYVRLWLHR